MFPFLLQGSEELFAVDPLMPHSAGAGRGTLLGSRGAVSSSAAEAALLAEEAAAEAGNATDGAAGGNDDGGGPSSQRELSPVIVTRRLARSQEMFDGKS